MTIRILEYLRHHALAAAAFVCSILALAGSSYAAFTISGSQIRNHTINPVKFNPRFINGTVRAWAIVAPNGTVVRGAGGPRVTPVDADPGGYAIGWAVRVGRCGTVASVDYSSSATTETSPLGTSGSPSGGFATASTNRGASPRSSGTIVQTFNQHGQPTPLGFDVAVIC